MTVQQYHRATELDQAQQALNNSKRLVNEMLNDLAKVNEGVELIVSLNIGNARFSIDAKFITEMFKLQSGKIDKQVEEVTNEFKNL